MPTVAEQIPIQRFHPCSSVVRFFPTVSAARLRYASGICGFVVVVISRGLVPMEEEDLAQHFIGINFAGSGVLLEISRVTKPSHSGSKGVRDDDAAAA